MEKKLVRIHLMMAPSEVEALDEYRFENRISSRSEALRKLAAEGIKSYIERVKQPPLPLK